MARILVVDDEKSVRITLRALLRDAGYEVGVAEDAEEALGMLAAEEFDVVLTDIIMPRITGVRLLQSIKETSPHVQVILMTGEPTVETASEAVRTDAFDYLFKPIGKEQLLKCVANAVKVKTLDDERRRLAEDNRQYRENLERLVEERTAALKSLARQLVDVQEAERRHIAMELHDEIGQMLTVLKLLLETTDLTDLQTVQEMRSKAQSLTDELMSKVRDLSLDLRPAILDDLGLLPTLQWHTKRYTTQTGIAVDLQQTSLSKRRFPTEIETAAYRIVQEALTNVARHAGVERVSVRAQAEDDALRLQIEDAGAGFDAHRVLQAHETGGLSGIRERAALIGGEVTISSYLGRGTCISAVLPLSMVAFP